MPRQPFSFLRACSHPAPAYTSRPSRLLLGYEMIRGVAPGSNRNPFHLHRRRRGDCYSDRDLHDARWNQGGYLDRCDPGFYYDWQRLVAARPALLRNSRRLDMKSRNVIGGFHFSDFIATGLDPAKSGWDKIKGMFADRVHDFCRPDWIDIHDHVDTRHRSGHGPTNVDRARCSPQPAVADHVRPRRHSDRVHVSQHRRVALGFLSNASTTRPCRKRRTKFSAITFSMKCQSGFAACCSLESSRPRWVR